MFAQPVEPECDNDEGEDEDDEDHEEDEDDDDEEDDEDEEEKTALTPQEFSFSCRVSPSKSFRGESGAFAEIRFSRFQSLFFLDLAYFQQRGGECTADSTRSSLCTTGVEEEEDHLEFELSITSIVSTKLCNRLLRI